MSIAERLSRLCDEAGETLVTDAVRARLSAAAEVAEGTNAEITLECHLGAAFGRVDLVLGLTRDDGERMRRRDLAPEPLARFLDRWRDPEDVLGAVPYLELEIDLDPRSDKPPSTWIGPTIEPGLGGGLAELAATRPGSPREWPSCRLAMAVAAEAGLDTPRWRERLNQVFASLPRTGAIHHFAAFQTRTKGGVGARMIVSLPRYDVGRYLAAVGFGGDVTSVGAMLDEVVPHEGQVDLDLDLGLTAASSRTATYVGMVAPRRVSSVYRDTMCMLERWCHIPGSQLAALDAWAARADGKITRELSIKVGRDRELFAKAYLQSRRDPYRIVGHPWGGSTVPTALASRSEPPCG